MTLKQKTKCNDCGEMGHWAGDSMCKSKKKHAFVVNKDVCQAPSSTATPWIPVEGAAPVPHVSPEVPAEDAVPAPPAV